MSSLQCSCEDSEQWSSWTKFCFKNLTFALQWRGFSRVKYIMSDIYRGSRLIANCVHVCSCTIIEYGSTLYVGMAWGKNGHHIKSAQMTHSALKAISVILECFYEQQDFYCCSRASIKHHTGKFLKWAYCLSSH